MRRYKTTKSFLIFMLSISISIPSISYMLSDFCSLLRLYTANKVNFQHVNIVDKKDN